MGLKSAFDSMKRGGYVVAPWEKYLLAKQEEDNDRKVNVNAPSSIGGCLRARYYARTGKVGGKVPARSERVFNNGTYVHLRIQNDLKEAGILLMDEVPVVDLDYNIQGHTDGILKLPNDELGVLEIKSINERGFNELHSEKIEHRYQGLCYLHCIEKHRKELFEEFGSRNVRFILSRTTREKNYAKLYQHLKGGRKFTKDEKIAFQTSLHLSLDSLLISCEKPITKVIFLYENKNTQDVKEYVVSSNDEGAKDIIETILEECSILNYDVENNILPPRIEGARKSCGACRWCDFKDECFVI